MRAWLRRGMRHVPGSVRLAVAVALLATFTTWMAAGHAGALPWDPRWYLGCHTAMEVFSVMVAMSVFTTGWYGVGRRIPVRVALLSPAALAVGLLDLGHLMTVQGMPGIGGPGSVQQGIAFWLVARSVGTLALLGAALMPREATVGRGAHRGALLAALGVSALGYWQALAAPVALPPTWIRDRA